VALSPQLITFGVLASTAFSALMGVMACGKILQAIARDDLLPILSTFAQGTEVNDTPIYAVAITWTLCQAVLFVDSVNVIAQLVTMTSLLTFGTLSFATLALKAGGAPSFRPSFRYWNVWTAGAGTIASFGAMFFTEPYAASGCIVLAIFLFSAIHIFSPPKPWGDVSQNLNYHIVRKYLLRLDERKSRITHWRPQILLLSNDARADWNLIIFCNSLKKGALYVLGHVIKGEFGECLDELRQQNNAWLKLVDISGIKSFVNIIIAPDEREGARSLILSCGLGGMRPNIVCMAFPKDLPRAPPPAKAKKVLSHAGKDDSAFTIVADTQTTDFGRDQQTPQRDDVPALPTDSSRSESPILPQTYVGIVEDSLALQKALAIAYGFESMSLSQPSTIGRRDKDQEDVRYIDLWPVQIQSPNADKSHAWDTYTMVLQLGTILSMTGSWKSHKLRVSVFVEFKGDMEAEKRRVQMLLDNLRVPAKLRVFCLSTSGSQNYETIVQGMGSANANVESSLRGDPWWESLKAIRARAQELKGTSTAAKSSSTISSETKDVDGSVQDKRERRLFGVSLPKEHQDYFQRNMRIGLAHPRVGRRAARQVRSESESEMSASESEDELSSEEDSTDELAHLDLSDVRVLDSRYGARSRQHASRGSGTWRRLASSRSRRSSTSHLEEGGSVTGSYGSMSSTPRASDMRKARDHLANLGSEGTVRAKGRHWTQAKQVFSKQPTDSSAADEHEDGPAQALTSTGEQTHTPEVSASGHHSPMITFNDLPNKAQYLILNELIRIHSAPSTSVVLTALPAPEPGTAKDPHRSLRYLHLIDSLLGGGPPILGVHAKQLTMTSAL
jgi:potassium/chloride transporter 9